jgi:alkanesulfonate monooxygenase SsuD/methylene tetrahydromethanopterin reductase-like flavin-dependent oxidoreductase (luciferase family)
MSDGTPPIGLVLGSHMPPERIPATARLAEELGFGELWFSEDCFFGGAMSGITAALDATQRLPVGLGIASAVTRHPALHAMELATMSRLHPGRVRAGVGLGVPVWLDQMGLRPSSPLGALRECVSSLRRLLDGGTITETGRTFTFDGVELTHKPGERIPIYMGVVNEKGLRLSGELADGTVLSVVAGTEYVSWARGVVKGAAIAAGRHPAAHRIVTYALCSVDSDGRRARAEVRDLVAFYLHAMPDNALSQVYGIDAELQSLVTAGDAGHVSREMPDRWVDDLAVAGDPDECAARLRALLDAGSDSVGLWLFPLERADEVARLVATEVFPRL